MNTHPVIPSIDSFTLTAGSPPVACVDIGGTKVAVQVVDAQGVNDGEAAL